LHATPKGKWCSGKFQQCARIYLSTPRISLGLHEATILAQYIQSTSVNSLQNLQVVEAHHFFSDIHLSVHGPNEETASQQDNPTTLCTRENCDHVPPTEKKTTHCQVHILLPPAGSSSVNQVSSESRHFIAPARSVCEGCCNCASSVFRQSCKSWFTWSSLNAVLKPSTKYPSNTIMCDLTTRSPPPPHAHKRVQEKTTHFLPGIQLGLSSS
jgi:hypothetical protein